VKELVHTLLPPDVGHGKQFKQAALRIGLQGPMRTAKPGPLLQDRLKTIAANLGPLPHASLDISQQSMVSRAIAIGQPKKQRARMLKAECPECAKTDKPYIVRIAAGPAREIGPPHCPKHGVMAIVFPPEDEELLEEPHAEPENEKLRQAI
jgi:hypothetical protein